MKKNHEDRSENLVHFIQFLFPNGTRSDQWIQRAPEIYHKAVALWAAGFSLEIENRHGTIWMSAIKHSEDLFVDRFCENGPEVLVMVDQIINEAHDKFIIGGAN
jgi:hypothetical protein